MEISMNNKAELEIKDLFGFGFPALITFGTAYLIHIQSWLLSFLGLATMFAIWIWGDTEMGGGMATAMFISGLIEIGLTHKGLGGFFIALAVIIFVVPLAVRASR